MLTDKFSALTIRISRYVRRARVLQADHDMESVRALMLEEDSDLTEEDFFLAWKAVETLEFFSKWEHVDEAQAPVSGEIDAS